MFQERKGIATFLLISRLILRISIINSNSMKFTKISFPGIIVLFFFLLTNSVLAADIETSSQDTWEDAEWTFVIGGGSAGVPGPGDNVFLRTEAEITIENK